jgi:hypothetical protein
MSESFSLVRYSPCRNKRKTYYFSILPKDFNVPSITFTDYTYSKLIDGKWKILKTFSAIGHPSNLTNLDVPDFVWKMAYAHYIKFIKKNLLIHHHKGTYVSRSIFK